jgi:hypothetical protein
MSESAPISALVSILPSSTKAVESGPALYRLLARDFLESHGCGAVQADCDVLMIMNDLLFESLKKHPLGGPLGSIPARRWSS